MIRILQHPHPSSTNAPHAGRVAKGGR